MPDNRDSLLQQWGASLFRAVESGALGSDIHISEIRRVPGPRCGALEIRAGLGAGTLLRSLSKNHAASLRQFVPWEFVGRPIAFMSGRYLRVEAGWHKGLSEQVIPLRNLGQHPRSSNQWIAGRDERGATIVMTIDDRIPHLLICGTTGSGKSRGLCNAAYQLARWPENELILCDGKFGDTLSRIAHLSPWPLAINHDQVEKAFALAITRIQERIVSKAPGRTILIVDEFQEFMDHPRIPALFARIMRQGRSGRVHSLGATQHATVGAFGEASTRRCMVGKLAFLVDDAEASRVAVGGSRPRADYLLGSGDAYTVTPGTIHRIQAAWLSDREMDHASPAFSNRYDEFPEPDWESLGHRQPKTSRAPVYTSTEIANGILSAVYDEGRPAFQSRFPGRTPGSARADRILGLCRKVWATIGEEIHEHCQA